VAYQLCELANQAQRRTIKPHLAVFDCRMIEVLPTSREPMRSFVDKLKQLEGHSGILSISVIHGFMAGDVPDMGSKILVISDNKPLEGEQLAQALGMELFALRGSTRPDFVDVSTALLQAEQAVTAGKSPVVIADVWDNPGGGVPGDSTILLREALNRGYKT